jgi:serine/threonine protein kinase
VAQTAVEGNVPERFGRYVLLDRIGMGGMAEVFRAVMPGAEGFARTFVVKRILGELSRSPRFVEMFVEEARICALLSHSAIVQVYDFGAVEGNYFLAMEYLRGRDLASVMRKLRRQGRACPPALAAFIAHQLADGLAYAHDLRDADGSPLNIIHRDVSPANIMCLRTGTVKLLDFGIAKALGAALGGPSQEGFRGKVAYVAPEHLRGEPIDRRLDLFSLGVVLWEMLTGRRLFKGVNDEETLKNVLTMPVPAPSSLQPDVPLALDAIVARALEREPARRYRSADEMAEDLENAVRDQKYQIKLLPQLLHELFGAEGTSSTHPAAHLPPELLAAAANDGTRSSSSEPAEGFRTGSPGAARTPPLAEMTLTPVPRRVLRRVTGIAVAGALTTVLLSLLVARGGGGRSQAMPIAAKPRPFAPVIVPTSPAPTPPVEVTAEPSPTSAATVEEAPAPTTARARRRAHPRREHDRIARGLSIDPFAEAAARKNNR